MKSEFNYQSDSFDRQSQRFVIPLYISDELGNFHFSSTATLVFFKGHHYIIFAAHALGDKNNINDVAIFGYDGELIKLSDISIGYDVFSDDDIVVVDCFNVRMDGKNYFILDSKFSLNGFDKHHFSWTGFPSSWCKTKVIHKTKKAETLANDNVIEQQDGKYFINAKYFSIVSKIKSFNNVEISGEYNRKKIELKYKGLVSMGPSPEGMSGGAMYFFSNNQKLKDNIDDTYLFAGIGLEFKSGNVISGISRHRVLEILNSLDNEVSIDIL
ncbi:TPA: hypothetical protein L0X66_000597 [Citrobacter freundii]|nr:hypothetical protein [Citrobacter freundii]